MRLLLLILSLTLTTAALAEDLSEAKVTVDLVAEVSAAAAGDSFTLLFSQDIAPGWHTYWRNPGDSGDPPTLQWDLPEGVTISEFSWPYPERIPYGPLMNFGYHDEVHLPLTVSLDEDFSGSELTLSASGRVLVCQDICIPEKVSVSKTLPVGERVLDHEVSALFEQVRSLIPKPINVPASFSVAGEDLMLTVGLPFVADNRIRSVDYFPFERDLIDNPTPQVNTFSENGLVITLKQGFDFNAETADLSGIIVVTEDAGGEMTSAFEFSTQAAVGNTATEEEMSLLLAAVFAFLGGLILNLMPCVFPVLSIKILSLVESVHAEGGSIRVHGFVYAAGVVLSFVAISALLIALRQGGDAIGWGFQLQSPLVVGLLAYLFVIIGLNLLGVFEMGTYLMSIGSEIRGSGYGGSFATGVLATVVAAPCTAPFMGAAIGFALTQSALVGVLVFASLGAGMAAPYLVLCFSPALLKRLPRPGPWMNTMKQLLAFPMFASAIWLLWVLGIQVGPTGMMQVLGGALLISFAVWLRRESANIVSTLAAILVMLGALYLVAMQQTPVPEAAADYSGERDALTYSPEALSAARQQGPVLVNFTAAWCITCKVNELNALSTPAVKQALVDYGVTYLKADWTNEDPEITAALQEYGRSGVPLYLLYRPGKDRAEILPQILTEGIVLAALESL